MKPRIQKQRRTHRLKRVVISGLLESSNMKQASADYSVRFHAANRFPLQLQGLASPRTVQIQVDAECRCHKRPKNNRNFAKSGVRSARKQPRMLVAVERFTDRWISNYTKTGVAEKTNKQTNKPHSQGGEASDEEVWRNGQEVLCRDLTPRRALWSTVSLWRCGALWTVWTLEHPWAVAALWSKAAACRVSCQQAPAAQQAASFFLIFFEKHLINIKFKAIGPTSTGDTLNFFGCQKDTLVGFLGVLGDTLFEIWVS